MRPSLILWVAALAAGCGSGGAGPHVVLISIDTLRADHVGLYGYARDTTPHLDAYFGRGTVFENATSPAPCTIPAVRQYLSGGFDHVEERIVLAELLRERGYATAAVVSQQQFYRGLGVYQRGFEHFDIQAREEVNAHGWSARDARQVTDRALAWLDRHVERPSSSSGCTTSIHTIPTSRRTGSATSTRAAAPARAATCAATGRRSRRVGECAPSATRPGACSARRTSSTS